MLCANIQESFPGPDAPTVAGGQRCVTQTLEIRGAPGPRIGISRAVSPPKEGSQWILQPTCKPGTGHTYYLQHGGIPECLGLQLFGRPFRVQPTIPPVSRGIDAETSQEAPKRPVMTGFQLARMPPHPSGTPGAVACQLPNVIPIGVMREHEDHRVVGCAPAESRGTWIQHVGRVRISLEIASLLRIIRVVTHMEIPAHRRIFTREGVKTGHAVIIRQPWILLLQGIVARLQQKYPHAGLGQPGRECPTTGARPDNYVVPRFPGIAHG